MSLNNDDIKQLIAILQKGLSDESDDEQDDDLDEPVKKTRNTRNTPKKNAKKPKSQSVNKFLEMSESRMHKDDVAIDKKLSKYPPTPRTRQFVPLDVTCRICGKKEKVNPSIVESSERYKCNRCSSTAG